MTLSKLFLTTLALSRVAFAGEVYPSESVSTFPIMPNRPVNSNSTKPITVNFELECAATNLRAPVVPVAADACVTAEVQLHNRPLISVSFPGLYMDPHPTPGIQPNAACKGDMVAGMNPPYQGIFNGTPPTSWKKMLTMIHAHGGRLLVSVTTDLYPESIDIKADGRFLMSAIPTKVDRFTMRQTGIIGSRNGSFFGQNEEFPTAGSQIEVGTYGQEVNISARLYGAALAYQRAGHHWRGNCGGFYSPLMLFFDKRRPKFHGVAMFPLIAEPRNFAWPEAGAPGYFLALDKNHNGKIDSGEEMFGLDETGKYQNGFERLKELDANKDGVIDARDPLFSELKLWRDKNADGRTERGELIPIGAKRIAKIQLNYTTNTLIPVSGVAELREKADFYFYDDDGALVRGDVYDVWLQPLNPRLTLNE